MTRLDMTGQRHGRLVALEPIGPGSNGYQWLFQCDCGNKHQAAGYHVRKGRTLSCGCWQAEANRQIGRRVYRRAPLEERFWRYVLRGGTDDCWDWTNDIKEGQRGQLQLRIDGRRRMVAAPRVSWELHRGVVPEGQTVKQSCDNRKCVNPEHLVLTELVKAQTEVLIAARRQRAKAQVTRPGRRPTGRARCRLPGCDCDRQFADGLCMKHGNNLRERGDPYTFGSRAVARMAIEAFWEKVRTPEALEQGECWEWPGNSEQPGGYGRTKHNGETVGSRAAWSEAHGPIPDGLWVLHHCDNPPCCRPSHLYLGTVQDNINDMIFRGRAGWMVEGWAPTPPVAKRGEAHGSTRFSDQDISKIRNRVAAGESQASVARDVGMDTGYISRICRGLNRADA